MTCTARSRRKYSRRTPCNSFVFHSSCLDVSQGWRAHGNDGGVGSSASWYTSTTKLMSAVQYCSVAWYRLCGNSRCSHYA